MKIGVGIAAEAFSHLLWGGEDAQGWDLLQNSQLLLLLFLLLLSFAGGCKYHGCSKT